jgi:hypothetical protein
MGVETIQNVRETQLEKRVTQSKREYVNEPLETEANLKLENVGRGKRQDRSGYTNFTRKEEETRCWSLMSELGCV